MKFKTAIFPLCFAQLALLYTAT